MLNELCSLLSTVSGGAWWLMISAGKSMAIVVSAGKRGDETFFLFLF